MSINNPHHFRDFCRVLYKYLNLYLPLYNNELVLMCIGTDRATGDSLGPLVGYKLKDFNHSNIHVFGTLDRPVHAKNLADTISYVKLLHPNALIISIDACLGSLEKVGCVSIGEGSIRPGAGLKKELPAVGDLHIIGIVNVSTSMNMAVLQNTRLSLVMNMAELIASGIRHCTNLYNYRINVKK
ncbi:spore protease YyaC [Candidatus Epulonipiscioides gigas]|nr:spore protease YyaC [Epulopiscium sp. SCG-C07WGA-EpuloA2]